MVDPTGDDYLPMLTLPVTDPRVVSLFSPGGPNDTMLFATLDGRYPGLALIDDIAAPTQCVVRTHFGATFYTSLATALFLHPAVESLRRTGGVILVVRDRSKDADRIPRDTTHIIERIEFTERERHAGHVEWLMSQLCEECRIVPIDRTLFQRCMWRDVILDASCGIENFFAHGYGVCMLRGDEIVSEAYGVFRGAGRVELGVVTHSEHRGRNYASITCAHLISMLETRDTAMYWSCHLSNDASVGVARKLGFVGERLYWWMFYESSEVVA